MLRLLPGKSYLEQDLKRKVRWGFSVKQCILKGCFFLVLVLIKGYKYSTQKAAIPILFQNAPTEIQELQKEP